MQNLQTFHTFSMPVFAQRIDKITSLADLQASYQNAQEKGQPFLFIGCGSNLLFLEDFQGTVAVNQLKGLTHKEDEDYHYLHIMGGENWHQLVQWTVENQIGGLENLALIPGCVGSAPVQNIGAYGLEFKDVCDYVEVFNLKNAEQFRLSAKECQFAYRESIFKHEYKDDYIVLAVGLKLAKKWQAKLSYGELQKLAPEEQTLTQIFYKICEIRQNKLPDPQVVGNAGSFFKNPVVCAQTFAELKKRYPQIPHYPQENGEIKLAAGWLIDQCGLKGFTLGNAKVHSQQALVLINPGRATGEDIVALARYIYAQVMEKFKVALSPEVRFIGAQGEVDSLALLQEK